MLRLFLATALLTTLGACAGALPVAGDKAAFPHAVGSVSDSANWGIQDF